MNEFQRNLYTDLMTLCSDEDAEAFYYVDHTSKDLLGITYHYRVFTYRLASYTDFLRPNALECRGHAFLMKHDYSDMICLASMTPTKFFNDSENLFTMNLDYTTAVLIMDKLDGSLISTAQNRPYDSSEITLKSKTSFSSEHARAATKLIQSDDYTELYRFTLKMMRDQYTINFEYMSPELRIVLGYDKPTLKILNIRSNLDGSYLPHDDILKSVSARFVVDTHPIPDDPHAFVESVEHMTGIEGFVIKLACGQHVKLKTMAYCILHKNKDNITTPRRLFEACVYEQADDLRSMFTNDQGALDLIESMQNKVAGIYNHLHKELHSFYNTNKHLDRKEFAILGQKELAKDGIFGLAMNLYTGKECDLKAFMVKHYKDYGIKDTAEV